MKPRRERAGSSLPPLRGLGVLALVVAALAPAAARAHKPSDAFLRLEVDQSKVEGTLQLSLRDLDDAVGLDQDGDGSITWGELRARAPEVAAYALARLQLSTSEGSCAGKGGALLVDQHSDGA